MRELQKFIEIEFIKSKTPEELNEYFNQFKKQLAEKEQENQQLKALLEYLKEQTEHCRDYECGLMTTELVLDILSEDKEVILEQLLKGGE